MKYIKGLLILAIAFLAFSQTTVNAQNFSTDRTKIEQDVFRQLIKVPDYEVFDFISFQVDGDTVTLYGKVLTPHLKKTSERYVKKVAGVNNVVNNIEILPTSRYDDSIRYQITLSFANDGGSLYRYLLGNNPSVRIIVDGGKVTLEGVVSSKGDSNLANILANGVAGTFSVTNNLQISKGANN